MSDRHLAVVADRPLTRAPTHGDQDGLSSRPHTALIVHVLAGPDDAPRVAGVAWALEACGAFAQLALDAGAGDAGAAAAVLADLEAPVPVRHVAAPAGSPARRLATLLAGLERELAAAGPVAVMLHADDDAALAGALAAARRTIPVVRVGPAAAGAPRAAHVIDSLADLRMVAGDECAATLADRGIPRDRLRIVGDPLADVVRRLVRRLGRRRLAGVAPGRCVLAALTGPAATPELARQLTALAGRVPVVLDLSREVIAAWDRAAVLAPLAEAAAHRLDGGGFSAGVALAREAAAVVTDSRALREAAELLGVDCRAAGDPGAAAGIRPRRLAPARVVLMADGRAGARVAEAMVANFALRARPARARSR